MEPNPVSASSGVAKKKMDLARALTMMGLTSPRNLESEPNVDKRRDFLDKTLFLRTQELGRRANPATDNAELSGDKKNKAGLRSSIRRRRDADKNPRGRKSGPSTTQVDICSLHEAYQFLMKKYVHDKSKSKCKSVDDPDTQA